MSMKDWNQDMHKVYLLAFGGNLSREELSKTLGWKLDRLDKAIDDLVKVGAIDNAMDNKT